MSTTNNKLAKDRIINALGDLYRVEKHSDMTQAQKDEVATSIAALEEEYLSLLGYDENTDYSAVTQKFKSAKDALDSVKKDREELANKFVKASKLLGSIGSVLKLIL
ncbi:hypothetical protein [Thalassovita sp.]|uniref:hypothetical protein n=1 Tax=Thalassovita sp. TaxID=1979401 RepID=UPI002AB1AE3B|nr:hypothetical protein [Thalassovita sp.]|tara:strand:- start:108 stop:428 length:321 start_codon:yes stop_codon:yes gene_type:complete